MKKKISLCFALIAIIACSLFAFNAFAAEGDVSEESTAPTPISITSKNTVIELAQTSYNYNGKARTPKTTVTYTNEEGNKIVLVKGTDYKVTYSNNINAGKATAKIEGINAYKGTLSKTFTIKAVSIKGSSFSISLSYINGVYNGNEKKPYPTIQWNNSGTQVKLVKNKDYTVSYLNNVNMGQATVVITGKGNFSGTVKKYFKILPQKTTGFKVTGRTDTSLTLKWNQQKFVSGYQILKYDSAKKKYVHVAKVSPATTTYTVTGLKSSTVYKFKVRAYKQLSDGKTNYFGAYSYELVKPTRPARVDLNYVSKSGTSITVQWKTTKCTGYQITYSTDSKFKNAKTITVKGSSKSSYKINNVNKSKTYYVKVRAYYTYKDITYNGAYSSYLSTYYSNLYATYSSYYVNNANRTNNLRIASNAISGTIVQPGETFSFNEVVGPRTTAKGYKSAPVFTGTTGVEDGLGGGICQVASTMFNCALNANMGIVERHQHSQRVSYVPLGRDAAIYSTVEDFKWKNTTNVPIRVVMTVKDGKITCSFYTSIKTSPSKVSLNVTRNGNNFTLKRTVNGKVNYSTYSYY